MRAQVLLRPALAADAHALVDVWADVLRRVDRDQQVEDVRQVIDRVEAMPGERVTVAEVEGRVVGAVHLRATTLSPINLDPVVQAISPHVLPDFRRHGIGTALVEAAVAYAEELGIGHLATAVSAGARDSNRFMARLALGPIATLRVAPVSAVKGRLHAQRRTVIRASGRQLPKVLAARRSMRRQGVTPSR
ncbi:MAG: GNAT family N-acetyltransferase [Nocardioides sp.]